MCDRKEERKKERRTTATLKFIHFFLLDVGNISKTLGIVFFSNKRTVKTFCFASVYCECGGVAPILDVHVAILHLPIPTEKVLLCLLLIQLFLQGLVVPFATGKPAK